MSNSPNFRVSGGSESYALSIGNSGAMFYKDCMKDSNGLKFSTKDADNDPDPHAHLAQQNQGGWWYGGAGCTNPNGPKNGDFQWDSYEFASVDMRMKPAQ